MIQPEFYPSRILVRLLLRSMFKCWSTFFYMYREVFWLKVSFSYFDSFWSMAASPSLSCTSGLIYIYSFSIFSIFLLTLSTVEMEHGNRTLSFIFCIFIVNLILCCFKFFPIISNLFFIRCIIFGNLQFIKRTDTNSG